MFRAVRPVPRAGGPRRSGRLLPGRRRRRPGERRVPPPRPDPARRRARGDRRGASTPASTLNCYVDDELYVAEVTPEARALRRLPAPRRSTPSATCARGSTTTRRSSSRSATRDALDALEAELKPRFAGRLFVSKSLPYFLEFAHPDVSKGSGPRLRRRAARLHAPTRRSRAATARTTASCSTGPASASPSRTRTSDVLARADLVVPAVEHEEGVASLLEAYLDSLA